jgi:hypothetical protein
MIHTAPAQTIDALDSGKALYAFQLDSTFFDDGPPTVSALHDITAVAVTRSTRRALQVSLGSMVFLWGEGLEFPKESRLLCDVLTRTDMRIISQRWVAHFDGGTLHSDDDDHHLRIARRQRLGEVLASLPHPHERYPLGWWASTEAPLER